MKSAWSSGTWGRLNGLRQASARRIRARELASRAGHAVNPKSGAFVAASALAVAAWQEYEHRRVASADLTEAHVRVERLNDIKDDGAGLDAIDRALSEEWGVFARLGFKSVKEMADEAGQTIFIARRLVDFAWTPVGAVQTLLVDAHGDPARLLELYPTFGDLTGRHSWKLSREKGGDTAVLLQITIFDTGERGSGLGSTLRNALLHMMPTEVRFALTTTPVDVAPGVEVKLDAPESFTPAMRFHGRGGATPSAYLPGYKQPANGETTSHGTDVVVMRYERDEAGAWPATRPEMRVRSSGPLQRRLTIATRRLRRLPGRGRRVLVRMRPGARGVVRRGQDFEAMIVRAIADARLRVQGRATESAGLISPPDLGGTPDQPASTQAPSPQGKDAPREQDIS